MAESVAALTPRSPTTLREFSSAQQVSAFLKIYEGGKGKLAPVGVSVDIRDIHDVSVDHSAETVPVSQFAPDRSAPLRVNLPLDRLAPGPYLLVVEASGEKTASVRRTVRFQMNEPRAR
jgi:hypothetical protein